MLLDNDVHTLHLVVRPGGPLAPPEEAELLEMLRAEITGLDVESIGGGSASDHRKALPRRRSMPSWSGSAQPPAPSPRCWPQCGWLNRRAAGHVVEIHLEGDLLELEAGTGQGDEVAAFVRRHQRP